MSINAPTTTGAPAPPVQPTAAPPTEQQLQPLPAELQPLATELETYYRELPRLLTEGEVGRYAVVKGDRVVNTWDTFRDAIQFGYEKFGLDPFLVQPIDSRYVEELARHFGPLLIQEPA